MYKKIKHNRKELMKSLSPAEISIYTLIRKRGRIWGKQNHPEVFKELVKRGLFKGITQRKKVIKNDLSVKLTDWTTQKLKTEALSYDELINGEMPCYGVRDMISYSKILEELERRGVSMGNRLIFND